LADCLLKVYPEHQWDEVKLRPKTQGYYRDAKNLRRYIEWAAQELDVLSLSDWYEKRARDIVKLDGSSYPFIVALVLSNYTNIDAP
jgi:hypothetical protein